MEINGEFIMCMFTGELTGKEFGNYEDIPPLKIKVEEFYHKYHKCRH